jgi:hypothetical protein
MNIPIIIISVFKKKKKREQAPTPKGRGVGESEEVIRQGTIPHCGNGTVSSDTSWKS